MKDIWIKDILVLHFNNLVNFLDVSLKEKENYHTNSLIRFLNNKKF